MGELPDGKRRDNAVEGIRGEVVGRRGLQNEKSLRPKKTAQDECGQKC